MSDFPIIGGIVNETKSHPYTMLALVGLLIAVPYMYRNSASADDLKAVQAQISRLDASVSRGILEQRLSAIESELFRLNQTISERTAAKQKVDPLYYDRVEKLEIDKEQVERQLGSLK